MNAYPAPTPQKWTWAIEFHDGTRVVGTSPEDVVDRWGRLLGWTLMRPLTPAEVATVAEKFVVAVYARDLPAFDQDDAGSLLEALASAGALTLLRK